jgi:two-component system response regulator YesN
MIEKAIAYLKLNYASDIQLQQVAEHVFLSANYLSTLFRQKTGLTFREFLRSVRIEAAKDHICNGVVPTGKIAELVGYGDTSHFFRAFKNVTGMTPKTYRKSVDQNSK